MITHFRFISEEEIFEQFTQTDDALLIWVECVQLAEILAIHRSEYVIDVFDFGRYEAERRHKQVELLRRHHSTWWDETYILVTLSKSYQRGVGFGLHHVMNLWISEETNHSLEDVLFEDEVMIVKGINMDEFISDHFPLFVMLDQRL